jgi:transcriptional regulator with XRE-family HTH domain
MEKGFSMRKLADVADIQYTQVVKIETAQINTSLVTISALASALGIPMIKLFDFKIPVYPKPSSKKK